MELFKDIKYKTQSDVDKLMHQSVSFVCNG